MRGSFSCFKLAWIFLFFSLQANAKFEKIEHFFVLMMENQSFDRLLGKLDHSKYGIVPRDPDGNETRLNKIPPKFLKNFSEAEYILTFDPGHEYEDVDRQLEVLRVKKIPLRLRGRDFVQAGRESVKTGNISNAEVRKHILSSFSQERLPILSTLAAEFAVCDRWHSSLPGPTFPNRYFNVAATSGGLDDSPKTIGMIKGFNFSNGNIFTLADEYNKSWRVYRGKALPHVLSLRWMKTRHAQFLHSYFKWMESFKSDLQERNLPSLVYIEPDYGDFTEFKGNSQHPIGDIREGEKLIKEVYEAIRNSPYWEKSALIITYDEHGGFYDHVVPPAAIPPGDEPIQGVSKHGFAFDRLGVRVPAVIISPWISRGTVDHEIYDHTSWLATFQKRWGMRSLTQRDGNANTFEKLFSSNLRQNCPTTLPEIPFEAGLEEKQSALDSLAKEMRKKAPNAFAISAIQTAAAVRTQQLEESGNTGAIDVLIKQAEAIQTQEEASHFVETLQQQIYSKVTKVSNEVLKVSTPTDADDPTAEGLRREKAPTKKKGCFGRLCSSH